MKNILLLQGWSYKKYTSYDSKIKDSWFDREHFVKELKKIYNVYKLNFPGFANEPEPKCKSWNLDDYVDFVENYIKNNNIKIDYILGYSFGGEVATRFKTKNPETKIILVSPAIKRSEKRSKNFIKTPKFLNPLRNGLRLLYLKYIVKNEETKYGTTFLRDSYQNIVRLDLRNEINNFDPSEVLIIFGENDSMTPPKLFLEGVTEKIKERTNIILNGTHEIGELNTIEVIKIIKNNKFYL